METLVSSQKARAVRIRPASSSREVIDDGEVECLPFRRDTHLHGEAQDALAATGADFLDPRLESAAGVLVSKVPEALYPLQTLEGRRADRIPPLRVG